MVTNFMESIECYKFDYFNWGYEDAIEDNLLEDELCFCRNISVKEYLSGEKIYILGNKGTGKTALYKLTKDKRIQFTNDLDNTKHIIGFEEDYQFSIMKKFIERNIYIDVTGNQIEKYRSMWELYIVYRMVLYIRKIFPNSVPTTISKIANDFEILFGVNEHNSILDLLKSQKKTFSCRVDATMNTFTPQVMLETDRTYRENKQKRIGEKTEINLSEIKEEIARYCNESKITFILLFDRLDDFVTKEDYEIQKDIIGALVKCERSYAKYKNIKYKIFIRNDLFNRVDFTSIGYDKIVNRVMELKWNDKDIREFIAKRIVYNYIKYLQMETIHFKNDQFDGNIDTVYVKDNRNWLIKILRKKISKNIPMNDYINNKIMLSLIPEKIEHYDKTGNLKTIESVEFFATHFLLNNGYSTPRMIIIFLRELFSSAKSRYNNTCEIIHTEDGHIDYLKSIDFINAYEHYQDIMNGIFSKIDRKFENQTNSFIKKKGFLSNFSFIEICTFMNVKSDQQKSELKQLIAYLEQIGYLKCLSLENENYERRRYELPVVFRRVNRKARNIETNV